VYVKQNWENSTMVYTIRKWIKQAAYCRHTLRRDWAVSDWQSLSMWRPTTSSGSEPVAPIGTGQLHNGQTGTWLSWQHWQ